MRGRDPRQSAELGGGDGQPEPETLRQRGHGQGQGKLAAIVLHVGGMYRASEKSVVETVLSRRPGVIRVEANPVAQTANVTFDTGRTSVAELRRWVEECGLHCAGQSVPEHICDPLLEPDPPHAIHMEHQGSEVAVLEPPAREGGPEGPERAPHAMGPEGAMPSPHE